VKKCQELAVLIFCNQTPPLYKFLSGLLQSGTYIVLPICFLPVDFPSHSASNITRHFSRCTLTAKQLGHFPHQVVHVLLELAKLPSADFHSYKRFHQFMLALITPPLPSGCPHIVAAENHI